MIPDSCSQQPSHPHYLQRNPPNGVPHAPQSMSSRRRSSSPGARNNPRCWVCPSCTPPKSVRPRRRCGASCSWRLNAGLGPQYAEGPEGNHRIFTHARFLSVFACAMPRLSQTALSHHPAVIFSYVWGVNDGWRRTQVSSLLAGTRCPQLNSIGPPRSCLPVGIIVRTRTTHPFSLISYLSFFFFFLFLSGR